MGFADQLDVVEGQQQQPDTAAQDDVIVDGDDCLLYTFSEPTRPY